MSHAEITQLADENKVIINPATEETQINQEIMLAQLVNLLGLVMNSAGGGNNRLTVDVGTIQNALPNAATIGAVNTVNTVTNQTLTGNVSTFLTAQYLSDLYAYQTLSNITFS